MALADYVDRGHVSGTAHRDDQVLARSGNCGIYDGWHCVVACWQIHEKSPTAQCHCENNCSFLPQSPAMKLA
jgi:hypothetical protein